jgi:hypothetical protein
VLQRSRTVTRQQEEQRHANIRHKVDWKQDDEFSNLAKRKWGIYRGPRRPSEAPDRIVQSIFRDGAVLPNEVFIATMNENGIEDVNL